MREPDVEAVLREINGYDVATGAPVSTASASSRRRLHGLRLLDLLGHLRRRRQPGPAARARRHDEAGGPSRPSGRWAWPANRRMLYNRASADPAGKPWSERKKYVWWDAAEGRWTGYDVPDFPADKRPATARRRTPRAWTRSRATTRSS